MGPLPGFPLPPVLPSSPFMPLGPGDPEFPGRPFLPGSPGLPTLNQIKMRVDVVCPTNSAIKFELITYKYITFKQ